MKFCKDCKHYKKALWAQPRCMRPWKPDMVTGVPINLNIECWRAREYTVYCGEHAFYFEKKE